MDYGAAVAWLYDRQALGIKLGLEKVHRLLAAVDNPQDGLKIVHVAGTNGKGTVATLVADVLVRSGHQVGLFTSPHLIRFTERITLNGTEIEPALVAEAVGRLQKVTAELDAENEPPTFFELVTVLSLLLFAERGMEWAVLETGMGGRLDATNVVSPELSIITNVGMDHQQFLGDTIIDIAAEKAGIMKPGVPCVTAASGDSLIAIKATSQATRSPMSVLDEDYHVIPDVNGFALSHPAGQAHYDLAVAGEHQIRNGALAVMACDALRAGGHNIPPMAVQHALAELQMPGRLETIAPPGLPSALIDGAHNEDGAIALRRHLANLDLAGFHLITGFNSDKDWQTMFDQWAPLASHVHAVPIRSTRSLAPELIADAAGRIGIPATVHSDFAAAWAAASAANIEHVLVAGSLFLVGEARANLLGEPLEEIRGNQ